MGVRAIDDILRPMRSALAELEKAKLNDRIIHMENRSISSTLHTLKKGVSDFEFLSENLKARGFRDRSLWGRMRQAFAGLFGGF